MAEMGHGLKSSQQKDPLTTVWQFGQDAVRSSKRGRQTLFTGGLIFPITLLGHADEVIE